MEHTGDIPEHREVSAVGDGGGISVTVLPQVGPEPRHPDDGGASFSSYLADPPIIHGQGAQHKDPSH